MKLLIVSKLRPGLSSAELLTQYLESPHRNPPAGVKRLARWFSTTFDETHVVVETDDAKLVSQWLLQWGAASHQILPVMDDADVVELLKTGATK